jgi:hypothetical protein
MIYAIHKETKKHRLIGSVAMAENEWELVQADADGWIKWDAKPGKECPVPADAYCDVKHEDGFIGDRVLAHSGRWSGVGAPQGFRIVAYRPILGTDTKPEAPEWDGESWPPPINKLCEYFYEEGCEWRKGICVAHYKGGAVLGDWEDDGATVQAIEHVRPIRSEEDRLVEQALKDISAEPDEYGADSVVYRMIKAGYRKAGGDT